MLARTTNLIAFLLLILAMLHPSGAEAQGRRLIRDAEIEDTIRAYAAPIFQQAGLQPQGIDIYLIQDRSLNAFVSGGRKIFIHTGLLTRAETPLQVIGVIAHETGHIVGGHIVGRQQEIKNAQITTFASYLLGIGAAIASGQPGAGVAIISGGQDLALKGLLSYSRGQEQAADQAGVRLLEANGLSPRGILDFMKILEGQEILLATNQDPYLRSHPLTQDRIVFLENVVQKSRFSNSPAPVELVAAHARMRAKLIGFLEPLARVFQHFPKTDNSVAARYARAIAYYRQPDLKKALPLIDGLLSDFPQDPFFHELKGQMLFENGRLAEALPAYEAAVELRSRSAILRLGLAQVQIELNDVELNDRAVENLEAALRREPGNGFAWRLSATAYGRRGDKGMTALSLAEYALASGRLGEARQQSVRAQKILAEYSPGWLRAQDVDNLAERLQKKQK